MSLEMPNSEQAIGNQQQRTARNAGGTARAQCRHDGQQDGGGQQTSMPSVLAAASVMIVMVMAAPSMLIVAPSGIETE